MSAAMQADAIRSYYATDRNLRISEDTLARYATPKVDFTQWTLDTIDWAGDEAVSGYRRWHGQPLFTFDQSAAYCQLLRA